MMFDQILEITSPRFEALRWAEVGFDLIFLVEFSLRVYIDRHQLSDFAREFANWFDAALVLNSIVDMPSGAVSGQIWVRESARERLLRAVFFAGEPSYAWALVRCINALRTIRVMRAMRHLEGREKVRRQLCQAFPRPAAVAEGLPRLFAVPWLRNFGRLARSLHLTFNHVYLTYS